MTHGLYQDGPYLVLYLLVLIWVGRQLRLFSGRRKDKLAPADQSGKDVKECIRRIGRGGGGAVFTG